jgi:CheY-like chemotaxis protein
MNARRTPENPILLVDDEQAVIDSLSLMLRSNGIDNIVACTDSREAMAILRAGEIELVLLDLSMPHLLKALRKGAMGCLAVRWQRV